MSGKGIPLEELNEETQLKLGIKIGQQQEQIPDKWVVYGTLFKTLSLLPMDEAYWVVNKMRRDLERIRGK